MYKIFKSKTRLGVLMYFSPLLSSIPLRFEPTKLPTRPCLIGDDRLSFTFQLNIKKWTTFSAFCFNKVWLQNAKNLIPFEPRLLFRLAITDLNLLDMCVCVCVCVCVWERESKKCLCLQNTFKNEAWASRRRRRHWQCRRGNSWDNLIYIFVENFWELSLSHCLSFIWFYTSVSAKDCDPCKPYTSSS